MFNKHTCYIWFCEGFTQEAIAELSDFGFTLCHRSGGDGNDGDLCPIWIRFYNEYDDMKIRATDTNSTTNPATPVFVYITNDGAAESFGLEANLNWHASEDWHLSSSYSFFKINVEGPDLTDEGLTPTHMANLHSNYKLTKSLSFHTHLYYQDNIREYDISHLIRLDSGLVWNLKENMRLSVWGQNLLDSSHQENSDTIISKDISFIPRSFYIQYTLDF